MLLGGHRLEKAPLCKERFFGASTPSGAMDYIENLTAGVSKRLFFFYLLKGRPGTGKSTLLRKLAAASAERGLDTEIYSCAFDSGSLDMLLWPELDRCLFDSTAPHLYEPSRPNDEIIDMYAGCVRPGTDEEFAGALEDITGRYREAIRQGTEALAEAKQALDSLLDIYRAIVDPERIDAVCGGNCRTAALMRKRRHVVSAPGVITVHDCRASPFLVPGLDPAFLRRAQSYPLRSFSIPRQQG